MCLLRWFSRKFSKRWLRCPGILHLWFSQPVVPGSHWPHQADTQEEERTGKCCGFCTISAIPLASHVIDLTAKASEEGKLALAYRWAWIVSVWLCGSGAVLEMGRGCKKDHKPWCWSLGLFFYSRDPVWPMQQVLKKSHISFASGNWEGITLTSFH